jgi:hypothetical protein
VEANLIGGLTLAEVMNNAADARERHFGVALPGIVLSYDAATQTASIQPAVNRWVPDESSPDEDLSEPLPALQSVPVMWPKGRNFSVTGTLAAGDPVLLVCIDRDMSGWRTSGAQSDPQDARLHDWSSAVAIPGLVPSTSPFSVPSDAAALANVLDTLGRSVAALGGAAPGAPSIVVATLPDVATAVNAIILAFRVAWPQIASGTVGSTILKLGG